MLDLPQQSPVDIFSQPYINAVNIKSPIVASQNDYLNYPVTPSASILSKPLLIGGVVIAGIMLLLLLDKKQ